MKLLLTGATGKVGQNFLDRFLASTEFEGWDVVALCHNRQIDGSARVETLVGSLSDPDAIERAMEGVTHVLHLAAVKESPDLVIDVAIKGMFLLLEAASKSPEFKQFIVISGDCAVGHMFQSYSEPITETSPRRAYKGCYALTKVLEEVMIEQYGIQYGLNGTVLRAPWIMEKDDFKYVLTFGPEQFGGPAWSELLGAGKAKAYADRALVPLMLDHSGAPLKRNFVHVDDLVSAILAAIDNPAAAGQVFNISMNEPVDYADVAAYLARTRGLDQAEVPTPFYSNWLDNSKARLTLGWQPQANFETLVERAWAYQRDPGDSRKIWYPG